MECMVTRTQIRKQSPQLPVNSLARMPSPVGLAVLINYDIHFYLDSLAPFAYLRLIGKLIFSGGKLNLHTTDERGCAVYGRSETKNANT